LILAIGGGVVALASGVLVLVDELGDGGFDIETGGQPSAAVDRDQSPGTDLAPASRPEVGESAPADDPGSPTTGSSLPGSTTMVGSDGSPPPSSEVPATPLPTSVTPSTAGPPTSTLSTVTPTTKRPSPSSPADGVGWYGGGGLEGVSCTIQVAAGASIDDAIAQAGRGATVCVSDSGHSGEQVRIATPGVSLVATGRVTIAAVTIEAAGVRLEGFEITNGGEGVTINADDAIVRNNYVHDTSAGGIVCGNSQAAACDGVIVANNTVVRNVGVSVEVWGSNVLIERNDIRHPLYVERDTDTLRVMAGSNQVVRANYMEIPDINAQHADPHPDCIMMFDSDHAQFADWVTNTDVVIENNICVNDSDHNCFILSGRRQHRSGNFTIRNNVCDHAGANAFFIEDLVNVDITNNLCTGRVAKNCIALVGQVSDAVSRNNVFAGEGKLHQINIPSAVTLTESNNYQGELRYADSTNTNPWLRYRPVSGSPVQDAGVALELGPIDILGAPRDQGTAPDIGPYES
jgi:hypothetical protein